MPGFDYYWTEMAGKKKALTRWNIYKCVLQAQSDTEELSIEWNGNGTYRGRKYKFLICTYRSGVWSVDADLGWSL